MSAPLRFRCCTGFGRWGALFLLLVAGLVPCSAVGQAPLHLVNEGTTVRKISFRFVESQTFDPDRLENQIALQAPTFLSRVRNQFSFLPGLQRRTFPFDPLTLQKDVVRLRRFYEENGFLQPSIDYPATQLDTSANRIHVIFTIREGTPVTIQEMEFLTADTKDPVTTLFDEKRKNEWNAFRSASGIRFGERYTDFKRTRIEDNVRTWLRDQGFAFATIQSEARVDTTESVATLRFLVDPGPLAYVSEILVEGTESVSENIVRRELPFEVGDRFSATDVTDGQRALFDLNLFRVALADVPDQPRDSSVTVRYRVRESNLRAYSGEVGYGTQSGAILEGNWRHRNFQGDARTLNIGLIAETGFPRHPERLFPFLSAQTSQIPDRLFRGSVTLRQPYLWTERLSGTLEPFIQERRSQSLSQNPNRSLGLLERLQLNERQVGLNTTLIYDLLPFRSLSLQHSFARIEQFRGNGRTDTLGVNGDDLFGKSIFSLSGTFGDVDDFINPERGYIFRPTVEVGGVPFESGVDFTRVNGELSGYLPLGEKVALAGRLFGGILRPMAEGRTNLSISPTASDSLRRLNRTYQDRFSDYLFYAGGGSDVRGWASQLGGGKVLRDLVPRDDSTTVYAYRPIGARSKLGINLEMRLPFPGLGDSWRTALFVDAAYMDTGNLNLVPPANVAGIIPGPDGRAVRSDPTRLLVGAGGGLRYQTPFGFVRIDVAYKATPDELDLRRPRDVGRAVAANEPPTSASTTRLRRFRLHFGIGRSF